MGWVVRVTTKAILQWWMCSVQYLSDGVFTCKIRASLPVDWYGWACERVTGADCSGPYAVDKTMNMTRCTESKFIYNLSLAVDAELTRWNSVL
jgi:hypothetical protein